MNSEITDRETSPFENPLARISAEWKNLIVFVLILVI